jgi:hypothetical protein
VPVANVDDRAVEEPGLDERLDIERALATLSDQQRACVVLRDVAGLSASEAAGVLGTTAGTVRSRRCAGAGGCVSCWSGDADRRDEESNLRSMDVPDQWDDISRRARVGSVQPSEPEETAWPVLVAAAGVLVLVVGATTVPAADDPDVTETEPAGTTAQESDHPPSSGSPARDAPRRPLAEEQVVARGEFDGQRWTLQAQPFENGLLCLELTGVVVLWQRAH